MGYQGRNVTARRRVRAAQAEFDVEDLTDAPYLGIDQTTAEKIMERVDRGASIEELGDLLGMDVEGQRHPLAQRNPLFYFLTHHGEAGQDTIVYFPDEDTFYVNTPNFLYGDEDNELVNTWLEDHFGDGVSLEHDVGFGLICDSREADDVVDQLIRDFDGANFSLQTGTLEIRRFEVANQEQIDANRVSIDGGCLARVEIDGNDAIDALYSFYDGGSNDLYADARAKASDEFRAWFSEGSEHQLVRTLKEELKGYCKEIPFLDTV